MSDQAHDLPSLPDADLVTVTGGFMQYIQQAMGMAGGLVNQFGDDKAKQGFGAAQNILGQLGGMFGGAGGGAAGGGAAGGGA